MTYQRIPYPTLAAETLDQALDALVRGDDRALDRLGRHDPDLQASVEEVFALADLSGFADEGNAWAGSDRENEDLSGDESDTVQMVPPTPLPAFGRLDPWSRRRWGKITTLSAAAALLVAMIGTTALLVIRGDDRRDSQPVMLEAVSADPTPESTRELLDLPASTRPLTVAAPEDLGFGGMAAAGPTVVRLLATQEFTGVEGVDAETETVLWRLATPWSSTGISAGASGAYFVSDPNRLVAVDPATGADFWQVSFGARVVSMALQDADLRENVLFVWDESSTMTAIDTATGNALWETTTSGPGGPQATEGQTTPGIRPAIGADVVVMIAANGTLNAFDRATGEIVWSTPGFDGVHTRIAIERDRLMVVSSSADAAGGNPNLIGTGMDLATGTVDWQIGISGPLLQPAGSEDTFFYIVADEVVTYPEGSEITPTIVDYEGCCVSWTVSEDATTSPDNGVNGGTHIFGIDTASGTVIWSRTTQAGEFIAAKTIFPQSGGLFAVTSDGLFVWLAREYGGILGGPDDLGGQVVEVIPFSVEMVRYVITMPDGSLKTIRRTQPPG